MAKTKDKNKILITISAVLIVIAIAITCVATVYEKTYSKKENENSSTTPDTTVNAVPKTTVADDTTGDKNTAGKYKVATKNDPLGIRISPEQDAERVGEIPKGTEIEILAIYDTWGYVEYDGVSGWVSTNYTEFVSASQSQSKHSTGKYKIATQNDPLGMRTKPLQDAERTNEIPKGEEVEILAICGDWGLVHYSDTYGWLSFNYLEKAA